MRYINKIIISLLFITSFSLTVFAWDITIDLDYITENPVNSRGCVVNILENTVTATVPEDGSVLIKGDGTNGGLGWGIVIFDASYIFIEDGTVILGSSGRSGLSLISENSITVSGGGPDIAVTSVTGGALYTNAPNLTLEGELGEIIGGNRPEALFGGLGIVASNLFISGQIALIAGGMGGVSNGEAILTVNDGKTTITGNVNVNGFLHTNLTLRNGGELQRQFGVPLSILLRK